MTTATIGELELTIRQFSNLASLIPELETEQERLRVEIVTAFNSLPEGSFLTSSGQRVRVMDGEIIIEE